MQQITPKLSALKHNNHFYLSQFLWAKALSGRGLSHSALSGASRQSLGTRFICRPAHSHVWRWIPLLGLLVSIFMCSFSMWPWLPYSTVWELDSKSKCPERKAQVEAVPFMAFPQRPRGTTSTTFYSLMQLRMFIQVPGRKTKTHFSKVYVNFTLKKSI